MNKQQMGRNLYLPSLWNTRLNEDQYQNKSFSTKVSKNSQINDLLKMIQNKKNILQRRNQQNEQDDSQDEQQYSNVQSLQQLQTKYKVYSSQNQQNSRVSEITDHKKGLNQILQENNKQYQRGQAIKKRHFRIKTQAEQSKMVKKQQNHLSSHLISSQKAQMPLIKQQMSLIRQQISLIRQQMPLIKQQMALIKVQKVHQKLGQLLEKMPLKIKERNSQTLSQMIIFLQQTNPFFTKLQRIVIICLLKVCSIIKKPKKYILFEINKTYQKFYILLTGRVKISNKNIGLRKICRMGETIGEENYFNIQEGRNITNSHEKVSTLGETFLLQIQLDKFKKVKAELLKFGFKTQFYQLQSLIKRNYIVKNAIRLQKNKF